MTPMRRFDQLEVLNEIGRRRIVAVIRAGSADAAVFAAQALAAGGVTTIEVTYTTPGATDAIRELTEEHADLLVGAGTITSVAQAREAIAAGASFLVSPYTCLPMLDLGAEHDVLAIPGVMTPTEIAVVYDQAPLLKLFPAGIGGPAFLGALRGPFPDLRLMPTGGVSAENVADWLAAGAFAVAAGRDLCPTRSIEERDQAEIERRACAYVSAAGKNDA
jgi:2-dehydro-3-deoxyphosphogluconate aldolase/(4S)-4-hydroxy-2-oxoglutarate aldolase